VDKNPKGVVVYLLIAFAVSWANLATVLALGLSPRTWGFELAALPAWFGPAIAAFVVRKWVTREGFSDAGLALNVRKKWRYCLFAWLLPILAMVTVFALATALGARLPLPLPPHIVLGLVLLPLELTIGPLVGVAGAWGQEFGWRGYLQIRLLSHRPILAALATGFIWGLWQCPMYVLADVPLRELVTGLLVFFVSAMLVSIILGWLRLRTGSVWPAVLFHSANNSASGSVTLTTMLHAMRGGGWSWPTASLVLQCIAFGAFCAWLVLTGRLGKQTRAEQGP